MKAGLVCKGNDNTKIPLREVNIYGRIFGEFAEVSITQTYKNNTSENIEAIYTFPMPDSASVSSFKARIGDREVSGSIVEKEEAFKIYDDAVRSGNSAFLLEQYRQNIFQVSLGQILPEEEAAIEITYIDQLKINDDELRFMIPTVAAPRYIPGVPGGQRKGTGAAGPTDKVPDADFITPPVGENDYRVTFDIIIDSIKPIKSIESPSHRIKVDMSDASKARVEPAENNAEMDRDFVLNCRFKSEAVSRAAIYKKGDEGIIHLAFVPELPPLPVETSNEYIFLIDISGSMDGEKLEQAKTALNICLRNLSESDSFNLAAFESRTHFFSEESSLLFNQDSLDRATKWIKSLQALGGTEILEAIKYGLRSSSEKANILIFTDGQVGNEAEIIKLVKERLGDRKVFTFGIDTAVNSYFINQLAETGNGRAEFVYPGERVDDKVIRQFARINSTFVKNVAIDWGGLEVREVFPERITRIYDMEQVSIIARFSGNIRGPVSIKGGAEGREFTSSIAEEDVRIENGFDMIEKVWAKKKIAYLEEYMNGGNPRRTDTIKEEIAELSKKFGILSPVVSFVAVEERKNKATGLPETITVPVSRPKGWQDRNSPRNMVLHKSMERCCIYESSKPDLDMPTFLRRNKLSKTMSCEASPGFEDSDLNRDNILRILARNQMADGSFIQKGEKDYLKQVKSTALAVIGFAIGTGGAEAYKKQIEKSITYLLNFLFTGHKKLFMKKVPQELLLTIAYAFNYVLDKEYITETCKHQLKNGLTGLEKLFESLKYKKEELIKVSSSQNAEEVKEALKINEDKYELKARIKKTNDEEKALTDLAVLAILAD